MTSKFFSYIWPWSNLLEFAGCTLLDYIFEDHFIQHTIFESLKTIKVSYRFLYGNFLFTIFAMFITSQSIYPIKSFICVPAVPYAGYYSQASSKPQTLFKYRFWHPFQVLSMFFAGLSIWSSISPCVLLFAVYITIPPTVLVDFKQNNPVLKTVLNHSCLNKINPCFGSINFVFT
jgi:hypothetical protein